MGGRWDTALRGILVLVFLYHAAWPEILIRGGIEDTLKCLSIGTPKNNKFSICPKWKIHYFQVSQNLGRVQPHYSVLDYWDT